jgi:hypothetical protein
MAPKFLEGLRSSPPPLTAPVEQLIDQRYQQMVETVAAGASTNYADLDSLYVGYSSVLGGGHKTDAVLATTLTWDIRELIVGRKMHDELYAMDASEIDRRNLFAKLLKRGDHVETWLSRKGIDALVEPERPYSPKLVAGLTAMAVKYVMNSHSRREFSDVRWLVGVSKRTAARLKP